MSRQAARGQTLVLMAFTLLLLVVMVLGTLSIAVKTKEKMELQTLADTAAYSQAVMTARAFNEISILNRLQISYYVAQTTKNGLISFTGGYRGALTAAATELNGWASDSEGEDINSLGCDDNGFPNRARALASKLMAINACIDSNWSTDDGLAADDATAMQGASSAVVQNIGQKFSTPLGPLAAFDGTPKDPDIRGRLIAKLADQSILKTLINQANAGTTPHRAGPELRTFSSELSHINAFEVDCSYRQGEPGFGTYVEGPVDPNGGVYDAAGLCTQANWNTTMMHAAMGTRIDGWTRNHGGGAINLQSFFNSKGTGCPAAGNIPGTSATAANAGGSGHFGIAGDKESPEPSHQVAWGEDHMTIALSVSACGRSRAGSISTEAHVKATDDADVGGQDEHRWGGADDSTEVERHNLGSCGASCPSVWVRSLKFVDDPSDGAEGQPVNFAAIDRDLLGRDTVNGDPWARSFSLKLGTGSSSTSLNLKGSFPAAAARQTALASGLTYFHRTGHWREFPNLLNPFWRATLAPVDVDDSIADKTITKVNRVLADPGHAAQREAFNKLLDVGFEGLH